MPGKFVELGERARVEQSVDPLPRGHLPPGVLSFNGPRRAGVDRLIAALLEVSYLAGGGMQVQPGSVVGLGARDRVRLRDRIGGHAGQGRAESPDPAHRAAVCSIAHNLTSVCSQPWITLIGRSPQRARPARHLTKPPCALPC